MTTMAEDQSILGPDDWAFPAETLAFLRGLQADNTRESFAANKAVYETAFRAPAAAFSTQMAAALSKMTGTEHTAKVFRIHRDLRFSKDKTPYNTHLHIGFTAEGGLGGLGWFFGVNPDQLSFGVGVLGFGKSELETYRQRVASAEGEDLRHILKSLAAQGGRIGEPELKRVPGGFAADHPQADLLRRKGLAAWIDETDPQRIEEPGIVESCLAAFKLLQPLHGWLTQG